MGDFTQGALLCCVAIASCALVRIAHRLDVLIWRLEDIRDALRSTPHKESP